MGIGMIRNVCIKKWDLVGLVFQEQTECLWSFISWVKVAITRRSSTDWLPPSHQFQHLQKSRDAAHKKVLASVTACVELPRPCVLWLKCYTNSSYLFYCTADWNIWTKSAGQQPACVFQYMDCLFGWIIHITRLYIWAPKMSLWPFTLSVFVLNKGNLVRICILQTWL